MAVVNTKSATITAKDIGFASGYRSASDVSLAEGKLRRLQGVVEVAAGDDDGSVFRMVRVRSSDIITSVKVANDAIAGGTVYDIGVYQTAENGGAVVAQEHFASDVTLASALGFTEYLIEAAAGNIDKIEQPLWQRLGLSADPKREYDIALTGSTVGTGAGTIAMQVDVIRVEG